MSRLGHRIGAGRALSLAAAFYVTVVIHLLHPLFHEHHHDCLSHSCEHCPDTESLSDDECVVESFLADCPCPVCSFLAKYHAPIVSASPGACANLSVFESISCPEAPFLKSYLAFVANPRAPPADVFLS